MANNKSKTSLIGHIQKTNITNGDKQYNTLKCYLVRTSIDNILRHNDHRKRSCCFLCGKTKLFWMTFINLI